ncbi:uncharacterized protein LOC121319157 [Polyodon spathula]|uniref:uncharacterized protein LOC121319157 n=1 Tax=Polyodon spathula TaxID=7913 RepID=UPI001B7EEF2F|nr:uncharacterized protein LOC121319157 [Polyodon spathula]
MTRSYNRIEKAQPAGCISLLLPCRPKAPVSFSFFVSVFLFVFVFNVFITSVGFAICLRSECGAAETKRQNSLCSVRSQGSCREAPGPRQHRTRRSSSTEERASDSIGNSYSLVARDFSTYFIYKLLGSNDTPEHSQDREGPTREREWQLVVPPCRHANRVLKKREPRHSLQAWRLEAPKGAGRGLSVMQPPGAVITIQRGWAAASLLHHRLCLCLACLSVKRSCGEPADCLPSGDPQTGACRYPGVGVDKGSQGRTRHQDA